RLGSSGGVNPSFAVSSTLTNVGVNPVSLAVSDLNADGTVDLAVANSGIVGFDAGNARILTNNGSGTFSNGTVLATGFNPVSIAAARVNADAFDDLITANSQSASISVFLRDPTAVTTVAGGTFLPPRQLPTSPQPTEIVPGGLGNPKDLDNDVAVVCQPPGSPGTVDVFANAGDGSGTLAPSVPLEIGEGVSSLALLDMDNDDDTDIAVLAAGTGPNAGSRVVRVLRNDTANAGTGQLTFALQAGEIVANSPTLIRAGDVNNDGQRDLITVNSTTGTFAARPGEPLPDGTIVAVAGSNETAADGSGPVRGGGDRTVSPIAVIRTAAPPPLCPGDLNGDSVVNTADLVVFLGRFGQSVPAYTLGDLNGNGVVNTADLVIFLGRFGQACP
ncbi:MAG: VCBS repeat-containing protein, partial [Planctomycetes bacterium]|nr:VCBS repeat-containing protein [Planctomycetota bacterium]